MNNEHGIDTLDYHLIRAELASRGDQPRLARAHYDSARAILEDRVRNRPPALAPHSWLGMVYARLGRREEAVREAETAVQILPISRDAYGGAGRSVSLAKVYVMVGKLDAATERIEQVLAVPSDLSVPLLRVDPLYDPLREHPGFQAVLERYE